MNVNLEGWKGVFGQDCSFVSACVWIIVIISPFGLLQQTDSGSGFDLGLKHAQRPKPIGAKIENVGAFLRLISVKLLLEC